MNGKNTRRLHFLRINKCVSRSKKKIELQVEANIVLPWQKVIFNPLKFNIRKMVGTRETYWNLRLFPIKTREKFEARGKIVVMVRTPTSIQHFSHKFLKETEICSFNPYQTIHLTENDVVILTTKQNCLRLLHKEWSKLYWIS